MVVDDDGEVTATVTELPLEMLLWNAPKPPDLPQLRDWLEDCVEYQWPRYITAGVTPETTTSSCLRILSVMESGYLVGASWDCLLERAWIVVRNSNYDPEGRWWKCPTPAIPDPDDPRSLEELCPDVLTRAYEAAGTPLDLNSPADQRRLETKCAGEVLFIRSVTDPAASWPEQCARVWEFGHTWREITTGNGSFTGSRSCL